MLEPTLGIIALLVTDYDQPPITTLRKTTNNSLIFTKIAVAAQWNKLVKQLFREILEMWAFGMPSDLCFLPGSQLA